MIEHGHGSAGQSGTGELERYDFEDLEVFQLALEIADATDEIALEVKEDRPWAADQLGRAGLSCLANTAEGNGEHSPGDKARFYRYARRSATETAAILIFLVRRAAITRAAEAHIRGFILRFLTRITRLTMHFDSKARAARRGWKPRQR